MFDANLRRRLLPGLFVLCTAFVLTLTSLREGEDLLIQRQYKQAVVALQKALRDGVPEGERDRALLLLGRAQWLAKDVPAAVATYRRLIRELPGSPLVHKARFQQAEALASAGDHRAAAPIYQAEIERLVGLSRKEEVAATYLGLAEKALTQEKPDRGRAVTFFDLALDLGLSAAKARSVRLQAAHARLQANNYPDAVRRYAPLVKELKLGEGKLQAMLGLGRARGRSGQVAQARSVLRDLIGLAPKSLEAADAAHEIALTYGVPAPPARNLDRAVAALREFHKGYPAHPQAKIAEYLIARCYAFAGRSEDALASLRAFLNEDFADVPEVPLARAMVGDVLNGQGRRTEAIAAWQTFLKSHPSHRDWERVQRAIVDAEYQMAMTAYQEGAKRFDAARQSFARFSNSYPIDKRNPQIQFLLGEMLFVEKKYDLAREAFARCVSKYPGSEAASHAQFRIGEIFETRTFNYAEALAAYRKVKWGGWRDDAARRIQQLTRKHLDLFTARTYRTGEAASFSLTSRNIEKVRVRVFRLDMETYFRSTHTAGQVERLDIEVIEPDKTFDSAVPEYIQYKETKRDVEIGFREPGAYVVKVDDRELEATTMVLVTDIAIIAKSSRHEFFVFTQNLKENRVESGVQVVLSDGKKVLAEGVTDARGAWRYKGPELKNSNDLKVFAVNAAGSGASNLDLSGMGYSQGLTPKGYLFTDRPVYQPGQRVHIKGIVREVGDGVYRLPAATGYRVQVISASGRLILQRAVEFSGFGTFGIDVTLPPQAVLGEWRVRVDQGERGNQGFTGGFEVARYQRPRLQLEAEPSQRVVYRGERIEGVFKLRYFFGEPAVGKSLSYSMRLPDGGMVERQAITNASGEVEFAFETTEFAEEAIALIQARVAEENVVGQLTVPVVTTEFTPSLSVVRAVYLAGEPFEVTVGIKDRSGKALARSGKVRLLRRETVGQRVNEVLVQERDVSTAAGTGEGRVTFRAAKGGDYLLRVEAKDRFGTVVTAQTGLKISGDDDEIKLRLLSDRQSFKVGEKVRVKVANRAAARLALRTVQGDGILAFESQVLPAGESTIEFELQPFHAPNFALALAMIDGQKLHTADREFQVTRDLQITVRPGSADVRPGGEIEVAVETRDPQGRPVAAEVALALVDEALLSLHPDRLPKLGSFFFGARRETGFRTVSSCTWSYRGPARRMSAALLAEERRMAEVERLKEAAKADADKPGSDNFFRRRFGSLGPAAPGAPAPSTGAPTTPGLAVQGVIAGERNQDRQELDGKSLGDRLQSMTKNIDKSRSGNSAFDSGAWNSAVGLGGGAGGKYRGPGDMQPPAEQPGAEPAPGQPRQDFSETGAWIPRLVTGADGKASIKVRVPDNTTAYAIKARGVTVDTYVGEGEARLRARKDLQAGLLAPFALVEGDRSQLTTSAHNLSGAAAVVTLAMEIGQGGEVRRSEQTLRLAAQAEGQRELPLVAGGAGDIELRLSARSGRLADALSATIPVQPYGVEYRDGRAGHTDGAASFGLGLPAGREYTRLEMMLEIGRDPGRDLVRAALGEGFRPMYCRQVDPTNLALASRGLSCLLVLDHLEKVGRATPSDAARLHGLAAAMLSRLVTNQVPDGGVPWIGKQVPDLRSTAQAVLFLALARQRGFEEAGAPLNRAAEWLLGAMRRARVADRARAAWALAAARGQRIDYSVLNALHRGRASMAAADLANLALAWQAFGRAELAEEVLGLLRQRLSLAGSKNVEQTETVGLAAAALLAGNPRDAKGAEAVAWLVARQVGVTWGTPSATAAALRALVTAGGRELPAASTAEVKVEVNGKLLATVPATVKTANSRFMVPADWLQERDNKVRITVAGKGRVHYSALLNGFAKGFQEGDRERGLRQPIREYHPAFLRHQGKVLKPGFTAITGKFEGFTNKLSKLAVGESGRVQVRFHVDDRYREDLTPLVLEEWIPAGCSVQRESVRGNFDHCVMEPNRMVFYFNDRTYSGSVEYELHGRIPGKYKVLPTRVYGALRPDLITHGAAAELEVLPRGSTAKDAYRMTPDELYNLGSQLFHVGQLEAAGKHLDALLANWHKTEFHLRDNYYKQVARMMLFISVERKDSKSIVRFFEDLKEQYPDLVIPFDKIVAVGKAYRDLGEFEQSVMVFRAAAESSFLKEAAVANTLEMLGEVKASVRFLRDLMLSYPDLNTMRVSLYSIGQKLAALAANMPVGRPVDPKVGAREVLRTAANLTFRDYLIMYPEDPTAEEVSFAWATTCVEGKDLDTALAVANAALQRYPDSSFTDELLYTVGFAQFAKGRHQEAFATLSRVASEEFMRPDGSKGPSENKNHAIYLQGQIHHARGEPAKALQAYKLVDKHFSDAGEASDYFLRKDLSLPEVTTVPMDRKVELKLSYRNVKEVEVKVYRVDLMRLYILQKSLNNIRGIELHGIQPYTELKTRLGEGRDYRMKEKLLALALDKPGAYLVVVRGGDLLVTGMALRSDLKIEAQEFLDVGRIRVNVKDKDAYLSAAHVKVIGSSDGQFRSGETDLRGIFVGSGLIGQATVIVKKDDQYAFFRGQGIHQPTRYRPPAKAAAPQNRASQQQTRSKQQAGQSFKAWDNNLQFNAGNRARQVEWLQKQVLQNKQKGVEVYRTK